MGRLLVLRHAQSVWNAAGRWQGWGDLPLSNEGARQAHAAGQALAAQGLSISSIVSSDLSRARATAEALAEEVGFIGPLGVEPGLREHNVGEWHGLTNVEIAARFPGQLEALGDRSLVAFPGGEHLEDFNQRAREALLSLAARADLEDDVVAVSHGGVISALERWVGVWRKDRRHPNLSGWWLGAPDDGAPDMVKALGPVYLLPGSPSPVAPSAGLVGTSSAGLAKPPAEGPAITVTEVA